MLSDGVIIAPMIENIFKAIFELIARAILEIFASGVGQYFCRKFSGGKAKNVDAAQRSSSAVKIKKRREQRRARARNRPGR